MLSPVFKTAKRLEHLIDVILEHFRFTCGFLSKIFSFYIINAQSYCCFITFLILEFQLIPLIFLDRGDKQSHANQTQIIRLLL